MDYNKTQAVVRRKLEGVVTMVNTAFEDGRDGLEDMQDVITRVERVLYDAREALKRCEDY